MAKSPVAHHAGRINMKGKKFSFMTCRCCFVINFKDKFREKEDKKTIRDAMRCVE
jgi:hypothetical protein